MKHSIRILILFLYLISQIVFTLATVQQKNDRKKRGLVFRTNAAMGFIIAIAVPLDFEARNIFVSYNFEANYNLATMITDIVPGVLDRFDLVNNGRSLKSNQTLSDDDYSNDDVANITVKPESDSKSKTRRSLLSRKKMYTILESKISK